MTTEMERRERGEKGVTEQKVVVKGVTKRLLKGEKMVALKIRRPNPSRPQRQHRPLRQPIVSRSPTRSIDQNLAELDSRLPIIPALNTTRY
jgi:hypothetical protein